MKLKNKDQFMPIPPSFFGHPKVEYIINEYPGLYKEVLFCLWFLWSKCYFYFQDGILNMDVAAIEKMVKWSGAPGEFIDILSCKESMFIERHKDNEYHVHNWYIRNPIFDPNREDSVSKVKQKGGYAKAFMDQLKALNDNGVELEDCPWLYQHEEGWMGVEYKGNVLPEYMDLGDKVFYSREDFRNNNKTKQEQTSNNKLIKKHTKRCKKCHTICVSSTPLCFECSGI